MTSAWTNDTIIICGYIWSAHVSIIMVYTVHEHNQYVCHYVCMCGHGVVIHVWARSSDITCVDME